MKGGALALPVSAMALFWEASSSRTASSPDMADLAQRITTLEASARHLDFIWLLVTAVGFMFAFGASDGSWIGLDPRFFILQGLDEWDIGFFAFQVMFCGTAATIVSGAVAERMPLTAYILCSMLIAGLVYPVFVHWAWGAALTANPSAFLGNMGFIDFAGSHGGSCDGRMDRAGSLHHQRSPHRPLCR